MTAHQDEISTELAHRGADFNANNEFVREEPSVGDDMATENLGKIILDRMHGRWHLAIILAVIMVPIFSITGYLSAPVKFNLTRGLLSWFLPATSAFRA